MSLFFLGYYWLETYVLSKVKHLGLPSNTIFCNGNLNQNFQFFSDFVRLQSTLLSFLFSKSKFSNTFCLFNT